MREEQTTRRRQQSCRPLVKGSVVASRDTTTHFIVCVSTGTDKLQQFVEFENHRQVPGVTFFTLHSNKKVQLLGLQILLVVLGALTQIIGE